jgi:small nuclear ribonucleoprotein (snRNP)-like protein
MQFFYFFKTLVGKQVTVELKNDLTLTGILHSVDQYLNVKLDAISVSDPEAHPQFAAMTSCFIRGSVVRYIQLPAADIDTQLLQDAARRANKQQ